MSWQLVLIPEGEEWETEARVQVAEGGGLIGVLHTPPK